MPKFSVIIPAYNVDKYIRRCLDSIFNQDYKDFEVILVDDGSDDYTLNIAKEYDLKIIYNKHSGVSKSRNDGIKKATGEYLLFLDSDDYYDNNLFKTIEKNLEKNLDILRFQIRTVFDNKDSIDYNEKSFSTTNGEDAFNKITKYHYIDSSCCYAFRREYWKSLKYNFKENTVHEDFGLIPLILIKAKTVKSISYVGYNYYRRDGSIMTNASYDWVKTKVKDFYNHYLFLIEEIDKTNLDKKTFKSFVANSTLLKICELKGKDYKEYKKKVIKDKVVDNIITDTKKRKIKKTMLKISPKLTFKIIK